MTAYELMIKTNHHLIKGGTFTLPQQNNLLKQLLAAKSKESELARFKKSVKAPEYLRASGQSSDTRILYPLFFKPPYANGKKLKTIFYQTAKTQILSANLYELEILRLLWIFAPENPMVQEMVSLTLARLKTTCFGNQDDGLGECFDASLLVLRFLAVVAPEDTAWINSRVENYNRHAAEKKRPWHPLWYYWLCLSELPFALAKPEMDKYQEEIFHRLRDKSYVMNSEQDQILHPVLLCMLRNLLARYPEFSYLKSRQPYVSEKDGRLYFDVRKGVEDA